MLDMLEFLRDEGVSADITAEIKKFRDTYPEENEALRRRVPDPRYLYYGKDIWEEAITAILCGENLLLVGPKATGKNVLAENLATVFGRPSWNVSFYINTDAATLLGTDTFENGAVQLRKGPIYQCAEVGGFGVLDEINMAKNESLAVLHATLDFRRSIDMPGYERIPLHDATRFIATMNYGYLKHPGAERGSGLPVCGDRHARHHHRGAHQAPEAGVPLSERRVCRAVRRIVPGHPEEMRRRRAFHQASGPAGPAGRRAADAHRAGGQPGVGSGSCQQVL